MSRRRSTYQFRSPECLQAANRRRVEAPGRESPQGGAPLSRRLRTNRRPSEDAGTRSLLKRPAGSAAIFLPPQATSALIPQCHWLRHLAAAFASKHSIRLSSPLCLAPLFLRMVKVTRAQATYKRVKNLKS